MLLVTKGVTRCGVLQTDRGSDIAGINSVDIFAVVGMHPEDASQTLTISFGGVEYGGTSVHSTRIHAEEAELADIRVSRNLECERAERLFIRRRALLFLIGVRVDSLDVGDIRRSGHVINNGIQKFLHALVLVGSTAGHRNHAHADGGAADGCLDVIHGNFLSLEVLLHDGFVLIGNGLKELFPVFLCHFLQILGNLFLPHVLAELIIEDIGLHLDQIDDTAEVRFLADRELNGNRIALQAIMHHPQNIEKVSACDVHLVDVHHAGNIVLVRLTPDRFRLGFNAALGTEDRHRAVQYAKGSFHFHSEVHVTRCINNVDPLSLPETGCCSGGDGDASLLLLLHPVHGGSAFMGFADLVVYTGIIQDAFRGCGLAGVNMRHNANVSCVFKRVFSWHSKKTP